MNAYFDLGTRLQTIRKFKGLSQEGLADKLGYESKTTISHWENGTRNELNKRDYYLICYAFNLPFLVFEKENLTKDELIDFLNKNNELQNQTKTKHFKKSETLNSLCGKWYLYRFLAHRDLSDDDYSRIEAKIYFDLEKGYIFQSGYPNELLSDDNLKYSLSVIEKNKAILLRCREEPLTDIVSMHFRSPVEKKLLCYLVF